MTQEMTIFYMEGCPYCMNARKAVHELLAEHTDYAAVPVRWINENEEAALASTYDYYYVPAIYDSQEKLYEASPSHRYADIKGQVEAAFRHMLAKDMQA